MLGKMNIRKALKLTVKLKESSQMRPLMDEKVEQTHNDKEDEYG